jgi:phosphoglycerol transferase MdoB-like AlkP superfamily enzyme
MAVERPVLEGVWRRCLILFAGLLAAKVAVAALRVADGGGRLLASAWSVPAFLYQDFVLVLGVSALDYGAIRLLERNDRGRLGAARVAWGIVCLLIAYAAVNVVVARVFSTPLTMPMLGATGAALSDSIVSYATFTNIAVVLAIAGFAVASARILPRETPRALKRGFVASGAVCVLMGPMAAARIETLGMHRNAAIVLARTWAARAPELSPASAVTPLPREGSALDLTHLAGAARGRNVVWVILESTAAEYLGIHGHTPDPLPNLTRLAAGALVFDGAYSAIPESIKGLFSMLCATHPAVQTSAADYVVGKVPCPSIAALLASTGYRTAFFHSGRFRYLGMQGILDGRGFDVAYDAETIGGRYATSFGTDDASTARKLLAFVDELPQGQRFFAVYSPISGHHPYKSPGVGPRPFPERSERERYLNDLHAGDAAFGEILDGLTERGLGERTLFVVVGDHGEAFQQHEGNFAHTLFLYEENVRVPLIIAAPGLTLRALRVPQIASLTDIAPTTLALLGLPVDPRHEGRSLLDPTPGYARFYTDHGPLKLGLRHGAWKFIHETEHDRSRLFRLTSDPNERVDVALQDPERVTLYRRHLLDAASAQRARIRDYPAR